MDNKYKNGKIYKLVCDATPIVYYGSTIRTLSERLSHHKKFSDCSSKELFEMGNVSIHLIEEYPCNNKKELESRERIYIEFMLKNFNHKIICNKRIPLRTHKEYRQENRYLISEHQKEYYQQNKSTVIEKVKVYRQNNRETINEKKKEKIACECGTFISKVNKSRHMKTKTHLEYISAKK